MSEAGYVSTMEHDSKIMIQSAFMKIFLQCTET